METPLPLTNRNNEIPHLHSSFCLIWICRNLTAYQWNLHLIHRDTSDQSQTHSRKLQFQKHTKFWKIPRDPKSTTAPHLANVVLTHCCDWLKHHLLTANAQKGFFHFLQEFLPWKRSSKLIEFLFSLLSCFQRPYMPQHCSEKYSLPNTKHFVETTRQKGVSKEK